MNQLTVVETAGLAEVLILPDQDGFYSQETQTKLSAQIEMTHNLVYPINADGEKAMKADATAINKFATDLDKTAAAIYKTRTEAAGKDRDITKGQVKTLKGNREQMIAQFEEARAARLKEVAALMTEALKAAWDEKKVEEKYRLSVLPEAKESRVTDSGNLTADSKRFIEAMASADKAWQTEMNSREMTVELECRRAGIDTPFTPEYIGEKYTSPDSAEFNYRLKTLIKAEVDRMEAVKAKIIAEQEAIKQREIQDALAKQQAEADRQAREKAEAERAEKQPELSNAMPESLRAIAANLRECAAHADKSEYARKDYEEAARLEEKAKQLEAEAGKRVENTVANEAIPGKKTVTLTAIFEITVAERISPESVAEHFKTLLCEKLTSALVTVNAR